MAEVKTYSLLVPIATLSLEKLQELRMAHLSKLIKVAIAEMPTDSLVVRAVSPTDLGLAQDDWRMTTGATIRVWANSTIADSTIADNRFVALWGISEISSAQAIGGIRINAAGALVAEWLLDPLWAYPEGKGAIALSPVIIRQNLRLTVQWYVKYVSSPVEFVLDGAVCEKEGLRLKSYKT